VLGGVVTGTITDTFSGIADAATATNPVAATGSDVFGGITDALTGVVIDAGDFNLLGDDGLPFNLLGDDGLFDLKGGP
jgi:hypothetical protein